jgi:hypothetical protein
MLATDLHTNSFSFDLDYLPGSPDGLIRVSATDGLNTTQAVSLPIKVDPKAPMLSIASPQDGQSFDYGAPVIIRGFGADLRDGSLTGDQLQWSSNKDGSLGTGNTLISQKLSIGDHILSLSAKNSSGLASTVSIHIKINPPLTTQKSVGGSSILDYLVLGGLCLVVLAAVLLTVFFVRRRRLHSQAS